MGTITHMATGSQGRATGLALRFAEYVRMELVRRGMSIEALAKMTGMSTNYLATRLRGERVLNLKDFEAIADAFEIDPQEMLARVEFVPARDYRGRLVPLYGATISQKQGVEIFRTEDAVPPVKDLRMYVDGEAIEEASDDEDLVIPEGVSGAPDDGETVSQSDYGLAAFDVKKLKRREDDGEFFE